MHMGTAERSGVPRPAFQEKFVSVYEHIFSGSSPIQSSKEDGFSGRQAQTRFWDELLLLKVNESYLAQRIAQLSEAEVVGPLKSTFTHLFSSCARYIRDRNFIRVSHALETLAVILGQIFCKRFSEQGSTILSILGGSPDHADQLFKTLISDCATLLQREDVPHLCKALSLRLYFVLLTATDNVNTNCVAAYLFLPALAHPLLHALAALFTLLPDHHRLTQHGTLLLLLLLLWRHSSNPYAALLASPAAPLTPLLQAALCLLTPIPPQSVPTSYSASASAAEQVLAFFGRGSTSPHPPPTHPPLTRSDGIVGAMLLHFLLRLLPSLTSPSIWPPSGFSSTLHLLWCSVLTAFLTSCSVTTTSISPATACLETKLNLHILRRLLEASPSSTFLATCHPLTLEVLPPVRDGPQMATAADLILNLAIHVVRGACEDPGVSAAAMSVISVTLTRARKDGRHIGAPAVEVGQLWEGLVAVCEWSSQDAHFERPGAPEAAEGAVGILEFCLGSGVDILCSEEEVECLHAAVLVALPVLEAVERTAERIPHLPHQQQQLSGGIRLMNIAEVRRQYEVTVAAIGVRGHATEGQARAAVRKKGMGGMKLRRHHTHAYHEVGAEQQVLTGLARILVEEHKHNSSTNVPKVETYAT